MTIDYFIAGLEDGLLDLAMVLKTWGYQALYSISSLIQKSVIKLTKRVAMPRKLPKSFKPTHVPRPEYNKLIYLSAMERV